MLSHTNENCIFKNKPYLFTKQILSDLSFLDVLNLKRSCDCYLFAWIHNSPVYENADIDEDEFQYYLECSESWKLLGQTPYRYNLVSRGTKVFRDPYVKDALKQYDPKFYYSLCDKNKTPRVGRMYYSLLQYLYPRSKPPATRESHFWKSFNKAMKHVFQHFKPTAPYTVERAMDCMPKNTSSGFCYLKHGYKTSKTKGEVIPDIFSDYNEIKHRVKTNQPVYDYCMFAMRGHLSDRLKVKSRPVWLVSAGTTLCEMRFYQPFYDQINYEGSFFYNHLITGKKSLPRLNQYLLRSPDLTFYNTDMSGWDSFRAAWFHKRVMVKLGNYLDMSYDDKKLYSYCVDSAINTKVLFPNGKVYQKSAGIISGTAGTLLFNSLLNMIASFTVLNMMRLYNLDLFEEDFISKVEDVNWLGDDFSFKSAFNIDLERFAALMFKYFCLKVNVDKTIVTNELNERKYLGYQLKDGLLYRPEKELFQSVLYTERLYPTKGNTIGISFSRFFSYLLLGGINNERFVEFFYFYLGLYNEELSEASVLFESRLENIFKLLKDIWNINIPSFNLETFKKVNLVSLKYVLLYGWDFKFEDIL